jgi:DNA-binding response OmpR family regulator
MNLRVIVVDDSTTVLEWASATLAPHGIEVIAHRGPFGLLRLVREINPDLVLLDVNMPGLAGGSVCKLLRKDGLSNLVVCLYSSMPEAALSRMAVECGADAVISKTKDPNELATSIRRAHSKNRRG